MKLSIKKLISHPLGALYGTLPGFVAFFAAVPMFSSGMWDAALVDLAMAGILIWHMEKTCLSTVSKPVALAEKSVAWAMLIIANLLALLPTHSFPGSLSTAFAFALLICAIMLYFSGTRIAAAGIAPALWCCVFMPYHEEFMLLLSFPLRLSATVLSAGVLKACGVDVICSGTTLALPGLNIAITDACSGINQLDAFILIAFIIAKMLNKKMLWKVLHFAFIIPAMIVGNSLRIALTILLYKMWGENVLHNNWHVALGYVQILLALVLFLVIGKIFSAADAKTTEDEK